MSAALPYESTLRTAMSVKQDEDRARRPLKVWKEQSGWLNLNIIGNVLELEETMGLNDSGRLPSSSRIKFSWEECVEPQSESRRPGITARREGLTRKIDVGELNVEDASPGSILNAKHEELWSY